MRKDPMQERRDAIFSFIVKSYIETAEPVGSRTISKHSDLDLSPASIRNVMADLEEQGLIAQPHTSAGRVPTDKGYRYFVDRLMRPKELPDKERGWVMSELKKAKSIEGLAEKVSKVISELTESAALIYVRNLKRISFLNYLLEELVEARRLGEFFEEDAQLYVDGAFRVLEQPEFHDFVQMKNLLRALDQKYDFLQILVRDLEQEGIHVHIGKENALGKLENVSLVVKDYYAGKHPIGGIGAVGPTRMDYAKVVSVVNYVADCVTRSMSENKL